MDVESRNAAADNARPDTASDAVPDAGTAAVHHLPQQQDYAGKGCLISYRCVSPHLRQLNP